MTNYHWILELHYVHAIIISASFMLVKLQEEIES